MTRPDDPRRTGGFTLVELLVVLAVLAIAMGVVMVRLGTPMRRAALDGAGTEIRAALRKAGAIAVTQGRVTVFRGDETGDGYWIGPTHYRLAAADSRLPIAVAGRVSFFPSGGSSGGLVRVQGAQSERDILVDAVTGRGAILR